MTATWSEYAKKAPISLGGRLRCNPKVCPCRISSFCLKASMTFSAPAMPVQAKLPTDLSLVHTPLVRGKML